MNVTRGTPIARHGNIAASFWDRVHGLIGQTNLPANYALVLSPCVAIHALFLSFPIDVLHLDAKGRVLRVLPYLQPWRIGPIVWRSRVVIELPAGTAARTETVVGDLIAWREPDDESMSGEHAAIDPRQRG